jgi:methionine-rich copper-binding protein CopC
VKIGAIVTLATIFIFILVCTGPAMAAGEQNSSTLNKNASLNSQSKQASSQSEGTSDTLYIHGYWINTGSSDVNVSKLKDAGITDVFVSTSKSNPASLQGFITKFNGSGIRVHAWVTCFHNGTSWIDPSNQTMIAELTSSILNIATNYNIQGVHLDAARYPGNAYLHDGTTHVTSFIENIYQIIKTDPNTSHILLSAALMPETSVNGYYYGQDYAQLAPYLDFMVPMIYKGNYEAGRNWIINTTKYIVNAANGTPVVAGLQTYMSDMYVIPIPTSELEADIQAALDNGSSGYVLFRYGLTDEFEEMPYSYTDLTDILDAATWVKNYINQNGALPSAVSINSTSGMHEIDMPALLSLLARGLLYINNDDTGPIGVIGYENPTSPSTISYTGSLTKAEYINIATRVSNYMNAYGRAPNYASINSDKIYYQCLIEIFSKLLDDYRVNGNLPLDTAPPKVTGTSPVHNATKISLTAPVIITFNKNIKTGSNYSGIYIKNTISGVKVAITKTINGNTLTIQQTTSKLYDTPYQVYIPSGAITDIAGTSFDEVYTYYFTTISKPDTTPPSIVTLDPANNAVNIPNKTIKITFNENIKAGTLWIELVNTKGNVAIPFTSSISGKVLTIKPTSKLSESKYKIILHTYSITDLAGNPLSLVNSYFTVDTTLPTVTSIDPKNGAVNVPSNKVIKVTFSENIKGGSYWIELLDSSGKAVNFSKSVSGKVLTIIPTGKLAESKYKLILHTGSVTDMAGNPQALKCYVFSVVASPTVTKTSPTNNTSNFSRTAAITITFTENITSGANYSGIYIKNLTTGKIVSITKSISGKTLTLKMVSSRLSKNTYQVYLPAKAVKNASGNSLASSYTFKFKTI